MSFDKTKFMIFKKPCDKTCDKISSIKLNDDIEIERVVSFKYLGVILDPHMSFNLHYDHVVKKVASNLKFMYGIRRNLNDHVMRIMLNAYVHSAIDYALEIWAVQPQQKLKSLQNKIDRFLIGYFYPIIVRKSKKKGRIKLNNIDANVIRAKCKFLTVSERRDFVTLKGAYKDYKRNKLSLSQRTITNCKPLIASHNVKAEIYKKSIDHRTKILWNDLPRSLNISEMNFTTFKEEIMEIIVQKRTEEFLYY